MIKVLVVDDQPAVRLGLCMRLALETDITVIGEAGDGKAALELARALRSDVVLMDVEMPRMDGLAVAGELRTIAPAARIVMLSLYDDARTRARAAEAGATEFVAKQACLDDLLAAIRRAAQTPANQ